MVSNFRKTNESSVYKKIEDEKTRKDLKAFYGDEYQDMLFEEAVKCTDSELSLKIPDREHGNVVRKMLLEIFELFVII